MIYTKMIMVSIIIGTAFSKCKYAKLKNTTLYGDYHVILDVCMTDNPDYSYYQYSCDKNENDETVINFVEYSDANCQNQFNITSVTEMFTDIHCELQDECDYIQWAWWETKKKVPCGSGKPYKDTQYGTNNFLSTLPGDQSIGECIADMHGEEYSACIEIESCDDGIKHNRIIEKVWYNRDCSGEPAWVDGFESDANKTKPTHAECTQFIQCSDSTITSKKCPGSQNVTLQGPQNLTSQGPQSSTGIMDNKVVIVCASLMVIFGVIYGISSMF